MTRILLADDEPSIQTLMGTILEAAGYEFFGVLDGSQVLETARECKPDLVILDVMMPGTDGFRACRLLRQAGIVVPIVILSAKGDIVDKSIGFDAGADDYLVKPFSPEELLMRIHAHLRQYHRSIKTGPPIVRIRHLEVDTARHRLSSRGAEVPLTPKEAHILCYLVQRRGEIVTREELIEEVWGKDFVGETSSVAVFIRKLREKIEDDPSHPTLIQTVRNAGCIFAES